MKIKQFSSQSPDLHLLLHCFCAFVQEVHEMKFTLDFGSSHEGFDRAEVAPLHRGARVTNSWFALACVVRICSLPCRSSGALSGPRYACPSSEADAPICSLSTAKSAPMQTRKTCQIVLLKTQKMTKNG